MINEQTVFVLGAGASYPYGYPVGLELRKRIMGLGFQSRYSKLASQHAASQTSISALIHKIATFRNAFEKSSRESIDLFLSNSPSFESIGKAAIINEILDAERHSRFREKVFEHIEKDFDWYSFLFNKMMENLEGPDAYCKFGDSKILFITFNYDRSLEHFLVESLNNLFYNIPADEIVDQVKKIEVLHVYGCVDNLPWQGGLHDYRSTYSFTEIEGLKKNIKLIGDRKNIDNIEKIKSAIEKARRIFFLGFAYAPENLQILGLPQILKDKKSLRIRGTALESTPEEIKKVKVGFESAIGDTFTNQVVIGNCDCKMLLRKYL